MLTTLRDVSHYTDLDPNEGRPAVVREGLLGFEYQYWPCSALSASESYCPLSCADLGVSIYWSWYNLSGEYRIMSAKDLYHDACVHALQNDDWAITHDPLTITGGKTDLL